MDALYRSDFPSLKDVASKQTSNKDNNYNCIAWAFKDNRRFWWPHRRAYWPLSFEGLSVKEAFAALFAAGRWEETELATHEEGFEKVALYERNGEPTHAARLLPNGKWTSKLGRDIDISHDFNDLDGPAYGAVAKVYKRPIAPSES